MYYYVKLCCDRRLRTFLYVKKTLVLVEDGFPKIVLKVSLYDCFDGPLAPLTKGQKAKADYFNWTKEIIFLIGQRVKFVLPIKDSIF